MIELKPRGNPRSGEDPDGVRVVARDAKGRRITHLYLTLGLALAAGCVGYILIPRDTPPAVNDDGKAGHGPTPGIAAAASSADAHAVTLGVAAPSAAAGTAASSGAVTASTRPVTPRRMASHRPDPDAGAPQDPTAIKPGDIPADMKNITTGEYIQRLHDAGVYEGIGAFNPPGTKPNLEGLAVPPDYQLPEGYVRHFQTTDDGQAIEPILMYSPDYEFFDQNGNPIAVPEDRVVRPEDAPPGFPIRPIQMPPPREPGDTSR